MDGLLTYIMLMENHLKPATDLPVFVYRGKRIFATLIFIQTVELDGVAKFEIHKNSEVIIRNSFTQVHSSTWSCFSNVRKFTAD